MKVFWTGTVAVCSFLLLGCLASPTGHQTQVDEALSPKNQSNASQTESKIRQEKLSDLQNESQGLSNISGQENNPIKGNAGVIESETAVRKAKRTRKTVKRKRVSRKKKSRKSSSSSKRKSKIITVTSVVDPNSASTNLAQTLNTSQNLSLQVPFGNIPKNKTNELVPLANSTNLEGPDQVIVPKKNSTTLNAFISAKENTSTVPNIASRNLTMPTNSSKNATNNVEVSGQITTETPIPTIKPTKPRFFLIRETTTTKKPDSIKTLAKRPSILINKFSSSRSSKRSSSHVTSSSTTHEISETIVHEYDFTDVVTKKPKVIRKEGGPRFFLIRDNPTNSSEKVKRVQIPKIVPRRIVSKVSKTQTSSTSTNSTSEESSSSLKQILIKGAVKNNENSGTSQTNNLTQQNEYQNVSLETKSKNSSNTTKSESRNEEKSISKSLDNNILKLNGQRGNEGITQAIGNHSTENTANIKNLRKSLRRSRKVSRSKKKSKVSKKSATSKTVVSNSTTNVIKT